MNPAPRVLRLPYGQDPLAALAEYLADAPERLATTHVVLPAGAHGRLRHLLQRAAETRGRSALLGPRLTTLEGLVQAHTPPTRPILGAGARELLLVDALREFAHLFNHGNPWALAEALARLLDELTLNEFRPDEDLDAFRARLARAYGDGAPQAPMEREASLVHTLWRAYHQQLADLGQVDDASDYAARLARLPQHAPEGPLWIVADPAWQGAERRAVARLLERPDTHLVVIGDRHDPRPGQPEAPMSTLLEDLAQSAPDAAPTPLGRFLHACFGDDGAPLAHRARALAEALPRSPLAHDAQIHLLACADPEQEARAVALQLRLWLHEGRRRLGVVTEDRRLARRLRALLERHHIPVRDRAGWALSTTAAASALERLLQCIEEDFPHQALLDLLKSPFLGGGDADHQACVRILERDVVQRENVARGLSRYRRALEAREARLGAAREDYRTLRRLLDRLERHSTPLTRLHRGAPRPAHRWMEHLRRLLAGLEMEPALATDPAGQRLLEELERLEQAARAHPIDLVWGEFRAWLGRTLERYNFVPPHDGSAGVHLLNFDHSALQHFDALVVCGLTRGNRPAPPEGPFFNRRVRIALGLGDPQAVHDRGLHRFTALLHAAPAVLLTHAPERPEADDPEPWWERLRAFHRLAYGDERRPASLAAWARQPYPACPSRPPAPMDGPPRPALRPARRPRRLTAYAHQHLIDCPYRFYASQGLGLTAPEAVREAMAKSDYGNLVHRCLEALHQGIDGLPGPYRGPWDEAHRDDAIACLRAISEKVFAPELADSYAHRGWLKRWLNLLGPYVDWQIERAKDWRIQAMEVEGQHELPDGTCLHGRLDRIDEDGEARAVIDFKTGAVPSKKDVAQGEAVQLPHYALIAGEVAQVSYLNLGEREKVKHAPRLEGEPLEELKTAVRERLARVMEALDQGDGLPAWGDESACRHCPFPALCRRPQWDG